ncbi:VAMP5 protein, partial [Dyaphorophyia castanea]|nr:VAMP5 protein [Platysteira castanea]
SETRDPSGSGRPGAGPGPPLALPAEGREAAPGGGGRWSARDFPCPRVPACPGPACRACRPPCPVVALCPRPHGFLSPWSLCAPHAVPVSPCSGCVLRVVVSPISPRSPRCPHIVPRCPQAGLARCQREAEEVAELMRQNVARALEREGHLEQLQSRAQDLRQASEAFTRTTKTVTRRQRRRQQRWHLVALGLGLLLLFILGLALALALARASPGTVTSTVPTPRGETKHLPSTAGTL